MRRKETCRVSSYKSVGGEGNIHVESVSRGVEIRVKYVYPKAKSGK